MKTMPDNNEQWLLDGRCQECRKQGYCSTPCKRNQIRLERDAIAYISDKTGLGMMFDALGVKGDVREWAYNTMIRTGVMVDSQRSTAETERM